MATSNGRLLNPLTPDFRVEFADGGTFTSDEGTWDDVPRDRAIAAIAHGATRLDIGDEFSFSWEAVARMPLGAPAGVSSTGEVIAVILVARKGDQGCLLRIDRSGEVRNWRGPAELLSQRFAADVWRGQLQPVEV